MSDLSATNCGCNNNCSNTLGNSCNLIWIILLLSCFGGCGNGTSILSGNSCGCGCGDNNNNSCEWLIWILLLSCFCGNNNSCC